MQDVGEDPDLLDVINAILAVHRAPGLLHTADAIVAENYTNLVGNLRHNLEDAGSAYTVDDTGRRLVARVDPTVAAAVQHTIDTAAPTAADLLREAWNQTYGLHPDPTAAYGNAVRAVEDVLCPHVLPNATTPTLGTVLAHFRDAPGLWTFVLLAKDGTDSIDPLVAVLRRLWEGQHRHAGGPAGYHPQTPAEARAAVHLAATVVAWITDGALTRRSTTP